jgi:hypothetical protein
MHQQAFASPEEALKHHGVKGMRWGVRKEEEPVGRDSSSGRLTINSTKPILSEKKQKRVDKFLKRADVMGTQASDLRLKNESLQVGKNPAKAFERYSNNSTAKELERSQQRALKDAEAVKKGKLTSTQKKVIVGGVVVGTILAAGLIYKGQQSGAFNQLELLGKSRLQGQKVPFKTNSNLSRKMSVDDLLHHVAKPVNPGYSKAGGKMNCRRSTFAYELRRRGFDVHATTSAMGWGQSESGVINAVTPDSKNFYRGMSLSEGVQKTRTSSVARGDRRTNPVKKILLDGLLNDSRIDMGDYAKTGNLDSIITRHESSSHKVLEELAKQPNGARGEVMFKFPTFGHSMAYEVVDGVPHIFDSQKGTLYNAATKMVESKWDGFDGAEITRLDNVDLDLKFLARWATNVGGK